MGMTTICGSPVILTAGLLAGLETKFRFLALVGGTVGAGGPSAVEDDNGVGGRGFPEEAGPACVDPNRDSRVAAVARRLLR